MAEAATEPAGVGRLSNESSPVRVGVIGCGFQGQNHLKAFDALSGVDVVAVADLDATRLEEVADAFDVKDRFFDGHELLGLGLDLVSVCTMPNSHAELVGEALEAGSHVICEKPFALSVEEAAAMAAAAERAERLLMVGFNTRYLPQVSAVREFIRDGAMGELVCARGFAHLHDVPWWGKHYVRDLAGGGVLSSVGVHMLDLLMWLAGNPRPLTATASMAQVYPRKRAAGTPPGAREAYDVEDVFVGHVRLEGGLWFSIESTWLNDRPAPMVYSFDAYGSAGQAHLQPLELYTERDGAVVRLDDCDPTELDLDSSFAIELEDVVAAVRTGLVPERLGTARQAVAVQAVTEALYRSARDGHEVAVFAPAA
jgi:predicted dehydrogenase